MSNMTILFYVAIIPYEESCEDIDKNLMLYLSSLVDKCILFEDVFFRIDG